jgi:hypothetical protein
MTSLTKEDGKTFGNWPSSGERAKDRAAKNPRQSKANSEPQKDKYAQKCARAGNLSKAAKKLYQESLPAVTADTVDKLRLLSCFLHPEGELEYNKEFRPSLQQEDDFWESEEGRNLMLDAFSLRDTRAPPWAHPITSASTCETSAALSARTSKPCAFAQTPS